MNQQPQHPTSDQLVAFSRGDLNDAVDREIEKHLEECDSCCDTLNSLPEDTFVAALRSADSVDRKEGSTAVAAGAASDAVVRLADHPRYRIIDLVGKGGMGAVYRAEHRMMRRNVALKLINPRLINRTGAVDRFHREVQAAARLSHPNIVTSYDAEQVDDLHFLVMEFVEGIDLADAVKQRGPLPVKDACEYIRQATQGLQHAYEQGMVHRDIKPHNLMLTTPPSESTEGSTVKILDFGLASLLSEKVEIYEMLDDENWQPSKRSQLTLAGSMMGTPDFISPEQADDASSADTRSDIYSLGATFYYLLAGRPPFTEESIHQKLHAHRHDDPDPIETLRNDVSTELAQMIRRMMAKDANDRFDTPQQVVDALSPFVEQPRLKSTRRQFALWIIAIAAMLLFMVTAAATVTYMARSGGILASKPQMMRQFRPSDETISQDGVTSELGGWRIDATEARTIRLFEVEIGNIDDCVLLYQAKLKSEGLGEGDAYLEMLCHLPGDVDADYFSRFGQLDPITGTTNWTSCETPMFLQQGQLPDVVRLNLVVSGKGNVWIKDVVLTTKPMPEIPFFQRTTPGDDVLPE